MSVEHTDVGAYALGLLEEPDRREFEAHLARCPSCAAELAEFRGMRDLFAGLDTNELLAEPAAPVAPPSPPGRVIDMMARKRAADRARERRHRQSSTLLAAAAVIGLLAGGVSVGSTLLKDDRPPVAAPPPANPGSTLDMLKKAEKAGEARSATDPSSGVTSTVAMEDKVWGTRVALKLAGVRGPLTCKLVAVTKSGEEEVVGSWSVPPKGYGLPGSEEPYLLFQGGVSADDEDLSKFTIRITGGGDVLSVPV